MRGCRSVVDDPERTFTKYRAGVEGKCSDVKISTYQIHRIRRGHSDRPEEKSCLLTLGQKKRQRTMLP